MLLLKVMRATRGMCVRKVKPLHANTRSLCVMCGDEFAHCASRSPLADSKMSNHSQTTKCAMAGGDGNTGE